MKEDLALELMNQLLINAAWVAAPILLTTLIVGVIISVLQVATQLQEATLSYVPKLLAAAGILIALGPWMLHRVTQFAIYAIKIIPSLG
jgi:flagellar biosynthetic protein FliQ